MRWDEQEIESNVVRAGLDAVHPISPKIDLLGRVEVAYRFEDENAGASGEILGLNSFEMPGQSNRQLWMRTGIGAEAELGLGSAMLMLNATSASDVPDYWLSASYRIKF